MADFKQCIAWLKEKKKVRRKYFDNPEFRIVLLENENFYYQTSGDKLHDYPFSFSDIEADDWEIYCDGHVFLCECERNRQVCQKNCIKTCSNCGIAQTKPKESLSDFLEAGPHRIGRDYPEDKVKKKSKMLKGD